jgi:hypothetical protein
MIIDKIFDLTNILKNENEYVFNISISNYIDNYYLCSYRCFFKNDGKDPWKSNFIINMEENEYDNTKFILIEIENENDWNIVAIKEN